jgi:hypothetical protein
MTESEYTITIHVRKPGRVFDPAFHLTLQCKHCCAAWFKRVEGSFNGLPVECVNCGMIMSVESLFQTVDQSEVNFGE